MITWLASYPRSGNTFLRVLLHACFGLSSYSQYNDKADIGGDASFSKIVGHETYQGNWKQFYNNAAKSNDQVFIKTHDAPLDSGKAIYLVRDPRSVVVSFHKYLQNFSSLKLKREHTIMGATAFGSWGEHIASWRPDKRDNTMIIHFEKLIENPLAIAHQVGEFLNLKIINKEIPNFSDLKRINPNFFSSGSDRKNVSELDPGELNLLNFLFRTQMKAMGYEPDSRVNRHTAMNSILDVSRDIWKLQYAARTQIEENAANMDARERKLSAQHAAEIDRIRGEQKEFVDHLINSVQSSGVQAEALAKQSIALTEKFETTNERLEDLWKQKSELTATVEILRNKRSELSEESESLKVENRRLQDKYQEEIAEASAKIFALETKIKEQKIERKSLDSKLAYRERALEGAKIDLAAAKALLDGRTEQTATLRSQLTVERNRIDSLQSMMTEFSAQKVAREKAVRELERDRESLQAKVVNLTKRNQELSLKYSVTKDHYLEINTAVAPRIKSILTLKPMRYVWNKRRLVKRGDLKLDPLGLPIPNNADATLPANLENMVRTSKIENPSIKKRQAKSSIYSSYQIKKPLGIAVYTFDRAESVENVLESLLLQDGLENTHVWIDGDQGNPKKRDLLNKTEKVVSSFPVKQIHRNRGNYGFRKMMIVSMRKMFEMYERVLFLEDDCFPTRHTIKGFSSELDKIEEDDSIFSVYGHPFLTDQEKVGPIGRFQGWGWASTRDKLMPIWSSLLDAYLMSEDEYKQFIHAELNDELLDHIDVTPGRQPSSTLTKFFAWDEVLCFLAGKKGLTHKRTTERLVYNFGVGENSTHFGNIDHYRKPPFNMVSIDEIWDYF